MKWLHKHKLFIVAVMLPIICWVFFNSIHNGHFHKLPSGEIIYHSHPHHDDNQSSSDPFNKHNHTKAQFVIIQQLNQGFENEVPSQYDFSLLPTHTRNLQSLYKSVIVEGNVNYMFCLRAPPAM